MDRNKKIIKISTLILAILLIGISVVWNMGTIGTMIQLFSYPFYPLDEPRPVIKYGEFPFKLTYEIDGEIIVYEDTIICEFDGVEGNIEIGGRCKWETYLKSKCENDLNKGRSSFTLLDLSGQSDINEFGQKMLELNFFYGNGEYYMGDKENSKARSAQDFSFVNYVSRESDGSIIRSGYKSTDAYNKYKIRLIKWECAPPIQNEFK